MDVFIARQPIFDKNEKVKAYELLYRDAEHPDSAVIEDYSAATKQLVSTAMTVFDIQKLSNYYRAFVNFDCELILNDFLKTVNPNHVIIKLPEEAYTKDEVIEKLKEYTSIGYKFAIRDYSRNPAFSKILPYIEYILIDVQLVSIDTTMQLIKKYKNSKITLLAYKIETREEYQLYKKLDINYFQGYFFEKPLLIKDKSIDVSKLNYFRLINELNKPELNFYNIANIIKLDTALTYQLFKKLNKVKYIHMNKTKDIMDCLVRLGEDELHSWLLLIIIRRFNKGKSDELAKHAYIRGMFMELLMSESTSNEIKRLSKEGYLVGMFSMLPLIADSSMGVILSDLTLPTEIENALLNIDDDNILRQVLDLVIYYEDGFGQKPELKVELGVSDERIARIYTDCIFAGDVAFRS